MSTYDRDYDLRSWGESAKTAFTFHGIDTLLDRHMLPLLRSNSYYSAFSIYLDKADEYLKMAADGDPFDKHNDPVYRRNSFLGKLAVTILLPLLIAFGICTVWKSKMKTAKISKTACNYIPKGGFKLTRQEDTYLYRTITRTKIESNGGSSGKASSRSDGSSGRSGKY